jgi:hypothetical protein
MESEADMASETSMAWAITAQGRRCWGRVAAIVLLRYSLAACSRCGGVMS